METHLNLDGGEEKEMVKTLKVYWEGGNGFEPSLSTTETNGGTETADPLLSYILTFSITFL